jgi:hypothetical protein
VELQQLISNLHIDPDHWMHLAPSGLPFQRGDVLAPNLQINIDVLDRHVIVLDLVTENHPLEVLHGQVTQCFVQSLCEFCTLDLPLSESFLVLRDNVGESKMMFLTRVLVMQAALVHSEFHIWFGLRLPVNHKHKIITIICDTVLIYQIAQSNNISNSSCDEPHSLVVARHSCFSRYYHGSSVALQSHT